MCNVIWLFVFIINMVLSQESSLDLLQIVEKDEIDSFIKIYPTLEIDSPLDFIDSVTDLKADKISQYVLANVSHKQISSTNSGLMMNKILIKTLAENLPLAHSEILRRNLYHLRTKDEIGRTVVHDLVKSGNLMLIDEIIKTNKHKKIKQILNIKDIRGFKPFMLTSYNSRKDLAKILYKSGTKINQEDLNQALRIQLAYNRADYEYIDYLFKIGLRPNEELSNLLDAMFGPGAFGNRYNENGICARNCLIM